MTHKKKDTEQMIFELAELFKVFGDSTRIRILHVLFDTEELSVSEIAQEVDMTVSAVSHQLRILRTSNLIKSRKDGRAVFYSLADEHVKTIIYMGIEHIGEER